MGCEYLLWQCCIQVLLSLQVGSRLVHSFDCPCLWPYAKQNKPRRSSCCTCDTYTCKHHACEQQRVLWILLFSPPQIQEHNRQNLSTLLSLMHNPQVNHACEGCGSSSLTNIHRKLTEQTHGTTKQHSLVPYWTLLRQGFLQHLLAVYQRFYPYRASPIVCWLHLCAGEV